MDKLVVSIVGKDRPGIVAAVSRILLEQGCNVEDVTQTRLQTEFAGIFIVSVPGPLSPGGLRCALEGGLSASGLDVLVKRVEHQSEEPSLDHPEPFVVTTYGPDRMGLVAGITEVMARFEVNITNLKAVFRGGTDPSRNIMIYEVEVGRRIDQAAFREALRKRAAELGLEITLQHRRIFEAMNRV